MNTDDLATAVVHAREFAATFNAGDLIDEESGFTADNLLALIAAAAPSTPEDEIAEQLGDLA